jgi:hypothetical protein
MKDNRYEWRMYSLVMYNISSMQKGVQTAHAVLEYANRYKDSNDLKEYIQEDKTLIILDGGTSVDLKQLFDDLCEHDIKFARFIEPDLNDAITSVCFLADERVWDRKNYPDYEDWLFKNGHCLAILTSMPPQTKFDEELYKEWVEFIGGEKNVYLREIIKGKRLSM